MENDVRIYAMVHETVPRAWRPPNSIDLVSIDPHELNSERT